MQAVSANGGSVDRTRRLVLGGLLALSIGTGSAMANISDEDGSALRFPRPLPLDLSGQRARGGTDRPILVGGKAFRFNSANQPWAFQSFDGFSDVLRSEIRAGYRAPYDEERRRPYLRSEITEVDRQDNTGLEQWQAFDLFMLDTSQLRPYGDGQPPGQAMVCQIKCYPDDSSGAPLLRVEARSNGLRIAAAGNSGGGAKDVITNFWFNEPVRERVLERFLIQTIRSPTGTADGTVRVWRNGAKIVDATDVPLGHASTQHVWNKFGLYCRDNVIAASCIHSNIDCGPDLSHLVGRPRPPVSLFA